MSSLQTFNGKGEAVGEYSWPDELLELDKGSQAVLDVVVAHRAACRAGTASTLSKGEVAGSNRKPWRQKGLGRARAGYKQSPVWRGGAVAFGPKPGVAVPKVNRKVAALAFRRALSEKISSGGLKVLDELDQKDCRTGRIAALLKSLGASRKVVFVVSDDTDRNLKLSVRNLADVWLTRARDVSAYDLLANETVVATREAVEVLKERAGGQGAEGGEQ